MSEEIHGVDVSQYQGVINWSVLAGHAQFAYIRARNGTLIDTQFGRNWANAAGKLPRGAYAAWYPTVDWREQAEALLGALKSDPGELPPALDVEYPSKLWTPEWRANLLAALALVRERDGRVPLLYTGTWYVNDWMGVIPELAGYPLWLGMYVPAEKLAIPGPWTEYTIWQHSSTGPASFYGAASTFIDLDMLRVPLQSLITARAPQEEPAQPEAGLSQRDPRWKGARLGFGDATSTIGAYGCTLTCLTMAVNALAGVAETPATLNDALKTLGRGVGYTGDTGNLLVFGAISRIYPSIQLAKFVRCRDVPAPMADIDAALAAGQRVMVELDASPAPGLQNHWVLLDGRQGDDYRICDPWPVPAVAGELLSKYALQPGWAAARIITSVVIYRKE